jgi:hypothetical protein
MIAVDVVDEYAFGFVFGRFFIDCLLFDFLVITHLAQIDKSTEWVVVCVFVCFSKTAGFNLTIGKKTHFLNKLELLAVAKQPVSINKKIIWSMVVDR